MSSSLPERLRTALTEAMKARNRVAIAALRSALSALDNAGAVDIAEAPHAQHGVIAGGVAGVGAGEVPRHVLSPDEMTAIVQSEIDQRMLAAEDYDQLEHSEEASRLRGEAAVLAATL